MKKNQHKSRLEDVSWMLFKSSREQERKERRIKNTLHLSSCSSCLVLCLANYRMSLLVVKGLVLLLVIDPLELLDFTFSWLMLRTNLWLEFEEKVLRSSFDEKAVTFIFVETLSSFLFNQFLLPCSPHNFVSKSNQKLAKKKCLTGKEKWKITWCH